MILSSVFANFVLLSRILKKVQLLFYRGEGEVEFLVTREYHLRFRRSQLYHNVDTTTRRLQGVEVKLPTLRRLNVHEESVSFSGPITSGKEVVIPAD
jgi:Tfp pilus assembly ATPase PilU